MTTYINVIASIRREIVDNIQARLSSIMEFEWTRLVCYSIAMSLVTLVSARGPIYKHCHEMHLKICLNSIVRQQLCCPKIFSCIYVLRNVVSHQK